MAKELTLTDEQAVWLDNALYELKGLRGWSWDSEDLRAYQDIEEQLR